MPAQAGMMKDELSRASLSSLAHPSFFIVAAFLFSKAG
jgi:hypothetical protein